jgi:hypothetical protein
MYKSLRGFFPYLYGMLNLAVENSAAVSLYPKNNWLYLIIFILTTVSIPFLQRNRMADYFGFLFVFSLFAAWKHGMAREDISHARSLFIYVFMVMTLFILFYRKNRPVNIIIISIGLLAFYLNLKNLPTYNSMRIEFLGINNFSDFVNGYSSIKENANKKIMSKRIQLRWEIIDFINEQDSVINYFFRQAVPLNREYLINEINTFEGISSSWKNQNKDNYASD